MVINELISSMSTVLEMKSGGNVLYNFIYIVNRVVSGEIYTAGKNFTLPAWTNLTSVKVDPLMICKAAISLKVILRVQ